MTILNVKTPSTVSVGQASSEDPSIMCSNIVTLIASSCSWSLYRPSIWLLRHTFRIWTKRTQSLLWTTLSVKFLHIASCLNSSSSSLLWALSWRRAPTFVNHGTNLTSSSSSHHSLTTWWRHQTSQLWRFFACCVYWGPYASCLTMCSLRRSWLLC